MMHPRTIATIEKLAKADWFANVGKHTSNRVHFVSTWEEATKRATGEKWMSLCLEAVNQYRSRLAERDTDRLQLWNSIVREIKQTTMPLVVSKTKTLVESQSLSKSFVDIVQWDVLNLCMEAEYADVYPPGFYASQAYWYLNGHFPCGWDGEFPNGCLVVY